MARQHFDESFGASAPENYQRYFVPAIGGPLAKKLISDAALQSGERVLDVGCGTGVVTRLAAERVGPEGMVAGLDINPGMIAVAKASTSDDLAIEWRQGIAEDLPYDDDSFDVVLCQLSPQFVPDRGRALSEMHRVLAPGGRLLLNVVGPADPIFASLADAMAHHVAPDAARFVQAVFALHDVDEIEALMKNAGFADIDVHASTPELTLPPGREFLWQYVNSTPLAGAVANASDEARAAMQDEVLDAWAGHETDHAMTCRQRIVMATGRA